MLAILLLVAQADVVRDHVVEHQAAIVRELVEALSIPNVAADTAKGSLIHAAIRTGRSLFTAHTNADSASPGVSDALADTLGLEVCEVLSPVPAGPALDKWAVFVPAENAEAVRPAMFAVAALQPLSQHLVVADALPFPLPEPVVDEAHRPLDLLGPAARDESIGEGEE